MKNKSTFWLIVLSASFCITSCAVNKKAQEKADAFNKSMTEIRDQVYSSVILAKNDKSIDSAKLIDLKKQYAIVQDGFNKSFDKIAISADSNILDQAKCAVLNYKRVIAPYQGDFENSSKIANDFNQAVLKARNVSAIGITDIVTVVVEIFTALAKERIRVCKDNITGMKYKNWDNIQKAQ